MVPKEWSSARKTKMKANKGSGSKHSVIRGDGFGGKECLGRVMLLSQAAIHAWVWRTNQPLGQPQITVC